MTSPIAVTLKRIASSLTPPLYEAAKKLQTAWLRELGVAVIAMTPSAQAPTLRECAGVLAGRCVALVLGHEGDGLSKAALDVCDHHARIPLASGVDSLNVSAAAAVALYEIRHV